VLGSVVTKLASGDWTASGIGKHTSFDLGGGGPLIRAEVVSGYVRLRQVE
jgi:hypothetical protein